ncbi:MAG: hypothetical protein KIH63_004770 [Candidatus Saccharibacteria bacterium]|nr:hypothetical protein [Candidatus Saccharibacteria bacterium]
MFISDDWLVGFAGYKKAINAQAPAQGRGLFKSTRGNIMIAVYSSKVYRIDENLNVTEYSGTLATESGEVFMDENLNNQICIVDGVNAYIINHSLPPVLTVQTGGPLGSTLIPNYVCFHDTFFLIGNGDTTGNGAKWYAYSYASPTTISQTTELALQTKPDYAIAVKAIPSQADQVLVFGTTVCEIHTHIGGTQNYRRNSTVNVDFGCLSVSTIASSDQYIAWLGVNQANAPVIMVYHGQSAISISTDGIDYLLGQLEYPEQSTALFYRQDGHLFYQLTFFNQEDNVTILYDFDEKKFFHLTDQFEAYHPARQTAYFNQKSYFISLKNGAIYETNTDITVYDENVVPATSTEYDSSLVYEIPRTRITDNIRRADSARFIVNSLVFTLAQGDDPLVAGLSIASAYPDNLITEDNFDPSNDDIISQSGQLMVAQVNTSPITPYSPLPYAIPTTLVYRPRVDLSISKDGGYTYSNTVSRLLNPIGNRQNIITYNNLGRCNDLVLKFRFWGKGSLIVNNGLLDTY